MTFWIDICNSPHVLFFEPVIKELKKQGHTVIVTARDFASTIKMLENKNISFKLIGSHGGSFRISKLFHMLSREIQLFFYLRKKNINIALGHASYDSAVVAKMLKIPSITTFDYEYADTIHKVLLKHVTYCIIPRYIPKDRIKKFGIQEQNIFYFDGLKENIYLKDFKADKSKVKDLIKENKINIFFRPPAESSEYYRNIEMNITFQICDYLSELNDHNLNVLVAPRTKKQETFFKENYKKLNIIGDVYDGPQLMYWSDYVFSAGGTMIREAAALGTPAISITDLKIGAVDEHLIKTNKLISIKTTEDFKKITFEKKAKSVAQIKSKVFNQYMDFILNN